MASYDKTFSTRAAKSLGDKAYKAIVSSTALIINTPLPSRIMYPSGPSTPPPASKKIFPTPYLSRKKQARQFSATAATAYTSLKSKLEDVTTAETKVASLKRKRDDLVSTHASDLSTMQHQVTSKRRRLSAEFPEDAFVQTQVNASLETLDDVLMKEFAHVENLIRIGARAEIEEAKDGLGKAQTGAKREVAALRRVVQEVGKVKEEEKMVWRRVRGRWRRSWDVEGFGKGQKTGRTWPRRERFERRLGRGSGLRVVERVSE